jgi:hypothetical protein
MTVGKLLELIDEYRSQGALDLDAAVLADIVLENGETVTGSVERIMASGGPSKRTLTIYANEQT